MEEDLFGKRRQRAGEGHDLIVAHHLVHEIRAAAVVEPRPERFSREGAGSRADQSRCLPLVEVVHRAGVAHLEDSVVHGVDFLVRRDNRSADEGLDFKTAAGRFGDGVAELVVIDLRRIRRRAVPRGFPDDLLGSIRTLTRHARQKQPGCDHHQRQNEKRPFQNCHLTPSSVFGISGDPAQDRIYGTS